MAKSCSTAVPRAAFEAVWGHHMMRMSVCIGSPQATLAEAYTTGNKMVAMTNTLATTVFTVANVGTGGLSFEVAAQTNLDCSATGTVDHVALFTTGASGVVYYVTTCTSQLVASTANKINLSTFKVTIGEVT
jgi:hypothetical protein